MFNTIHEVDRGSCPPQRKPGKLRFFDNDGQILLLLINAVGLGNVRLCCSVCWASVTSFTENLAKIGQHFSPLFRRKKGWVLPNLIGRQAAVLVRCLNRRHPGLKSKYVPCHIIPSATKVKRMKSSKKILDVYFTNQRRLGGGCSRAIYDVGHRNTALQTSV